MLRYHAGLHRSPAGSARAADAGTENPAAPQLPVHAGAFVEVNGITVVGERINPTGKKRLQQALREGDSAYPCTQAVAQAEAGAEVLDVNAGLPGIDEAATLERLVRDLQAVTDLPLQLDSSNPKRWPGHFVFTMANPSSTRSTEKNGR